MNYLLPFTLLLLVACQSAETAPPMPTETKKSIQPVIALHGGAGDLKSLDLSASQEKEYLHIMDSALAVGYALLTNGASALDAVESVVKIMEDSPLFNAGKGAVFSNKGVNELDAAIMNGRNKDCGAVTGITRIKNPIALARNIMDSSKHVFLSGVGAEEYAQEKGFSFVDPSYFYTEKRWQQLLEAKKKDSIELDHSASNEKKMGTVGCVALDKKGNLAAATSTGGLTNKKYGRIGDSPVIGAGTYADNEGVAISCTGRGEDFIKLSFAHQVNALVKYQKKSVQQAVEDTFEELKVKKGRGGCVAITASGEYYLGFTTSGMFRGVIDRNGVASTAIYK